MTRTIADEADESRPADRWAERPATRGLLARARRATDWFGERPWPTVIALAVIGLVVRHAWLTTKPLSAGDWKWPTAGRILNWFPWPSVWTDTLGLSGQNRFADAFRFPVYAVNGLIATAGGSWTVIEKVVYFVPFAVLLPVAGWLFAREILGSTKWTLLAPVLLLANTYFLFEANGEIPLVLSEVVCCLALIALLRTMRQFSLRWALLTGLGLGAACAMDIRPVYLTVLLIIGYVVILTAADPGWRLFFRRVGLGLLAGVVFAGSQAFWIVPLHFYQGNPAFPAPSQPDFTILTLTHGLAGVMPNWTGSAPAAFVEAPLSPLFLVLPLLALVPLAWRRMTVEALWLTAAALVCAFLAKTNNPPLGAIYQWMYSHFPGFNLFREGSKFLFPIALAYAVLIPMAVASIVDLLRGSRGVARQAISFSLNGLVVILAVVCVAPIVTLESGALGSSTTPVAMPKAFGEVSRVLSANHQQGPVLWFGGPVYVTGTGPTQKIHSYTLASSTHPLDNLSGSAVSRVVQTRDVFQYFCPSISDPYCYVRQSLFPYLTSLVGATYVVSPGTTDVGQLPAGISPAWLRQQLTAMFGPPRPYGTPQADLLVWHLSHPQPAIATYPAVALVDSGPWSLTEVLPALEALDVPAVYQQTSDAGDYPAGPSNLPDGIAVAPLVGGACQVASPMRAAVLAHTTSQALAVKAGGRNVSLSLLSRPVRSPGWGLYGPVDLPAGGLALSVTQPGIVSGPCISWTSTTVAALGPRQTSVGPTQIRANGEQLTAATPRAPAAWVELGRTYDPGWHLQHKRPTAVADGLFNLYGPVGTTAAHHGRLTFTYSTMTWERRGLAVSVLTVIVSILAVLLLARRERRNARANWIVQSVESRFAPWLAAAGLAFIGLTALAALASWLGLPSRLPRVWFTSDPYNLDTVFASIALGLFVASVAVRMIENLLRLRRVARTGLAPRRDALSSRDRRSARIAAGASAMALFVAGCGITGGGANQALQNATQAGATSLDIQGATLLQARVEQYANDAAKCVSDYTVALRTYTTLVSAYIGRGTCYQSGGFDFAAAVHDFTRALALSPSNPSVLLDRAAAYQGIGDLSAADQDYQNAAAAPSASSTIVLDAVDGLVSIQEDSDAQNVVNLGLARFPQDPVIMAAASDAALAEGNDSNALADLDRGEQVATIANSSYDLGTVLSRACSYDVLHFEYTAAIPSCHKAGGIDTDGSGAFDNLSVADAQLGNWASAVQDLGDAIGAFQGNVGPDAQPSGVDGFGLSYLLEAQGRMYTELHDRVAALADYAAAKKALPAGSTDFASRLRADVKAAKDS